MCFLLHSTDYSVVCISCSSSHCRAFVFVLSILSPQWLNFQISLEDTPPVKISKAECPLLGSWTLSGHEFSPQSTYLHCLEHSPGNRALILEGRDEVSGRGQKKNVFSPGPVSPTTSPFLCYASPGSIPPPYPRGINGRREILHSVPQNQLTILGPWQLLSLYSHLNSSPSLTSLPVAYIHWEVLLASTTECVSAELATCLQSSPWRLIVLCFLFTFNSITMDLNRNLRIIDAFFHLLTLHDTQPCGFCLLAHPQNSFLLSALTAIVLIQRTCHFLPGPM